MPGVLPGLRHLILRGVTDRTGRPRKGAFPGRGLVGIDRQNACPGEVHHPPRL